MQGRETFPCADLYVFNWHCHHKLQSSPGGSIAQWLAYLLLDLAALHSITSVSKKIYAPKIVYVAEVYQWLEEVAQTHLVLASGKLMLQKIIVEPSIPCLQQLI